MSPALPAQVMLARTVLHVLSEEAAEVAPPEYRHRSYSQRYPEHKITASIKAFVRSVRTRWQVT